LSDPRAVAVDSSGNLYIAMYGGSTIRKVAADGTLTVFAGTGATGFSGDGGQAVKARIWSPSGVAADAAGALYIGDTTNNRVRKVSPDGVIATWAGGGSGDSSAAPFAQFSLPGAMAQDSAGNLYIADTSNHTVRKIAPDGSVVTVAGTGVPGSSADGTPAASAPLMSPGGVAVDSAGNLFIADTGNGRVRKIDAEGKLTTVGGSAQLSRPNGLAFDGAGNLYIAEMGAHRIRKISADGALATVAGTGTAGYAGDGGPASGAQLNGPRAVAVDAAGNLYIADTGNHAIRKISADGAIATVAGNGRSGYAGDGAGAASANLNSPGGVAVDSSGVVYIADTNNHVVRQVSAAGVISTLAGTGSLGYAGDGGPPSSAALYQPAAVLADASGKVYVADTYNNAIRVLVPTGTQPVFTVQAAASGGAYTVTVTNAAYSGTSSGPVTLTVSLSPGLTLGFLAGDGWDCSGNTCTRSDALGAGASYPPVMVLASAPSGATAQATAQFSVTGGGGFAAGCGNLFR
jgi:sugar lactone lactonase YvrE